MKKLLIPAILAVLAAGFAFGAGTEEAVEGRADALSAVGFNETGYPIVDQEVTMSVGLWQPPQSTKEPEEYPWLIELAQLTNVLVDYQFLGSGQEAQQTVNLHVASGEMLDLYGQWVYEQGQVLQWAADGQVMYLDELIEDYSPNLATILDGFPEARNAVIDFETDQIVFTPIVGLPHRFAHGIPVIAAEWLDRLGMEMPGTADELLDVLRAFRDQDANGNGDPDDEIPAMFNLGNPSWWGGQRTPGYVASYFFQIPMGTRAIVQDGAIVPWYRHENAQDFVAFLATLYQEDLIPEDSLSIDNPSYNARAAEGNVGLVHNWTTRHTLNNDRAYDQYVWFFPDEASGGFYHRFQVDGFVQPAWFMSASAEHPEIAMRWLDTIYSKEHGKRIAQGPGEYVDDEMTLWRTEAPPEGVSAGEYRNNTFVPKNAFPDFQYPGDFIDVTPGSEWEYHAYHREVAQRGLVPDQVGPTRLWPISAEENNRYTPLLQEVNAYLETEIASMIFEGDVSDERWQNFQDELMRLGLDEMMEIDATVYQRALDAGYNPVVTESAVFQEALNLNIDVLPGFMELGQPEW